ncbi:hypothetical protein [Wolbachia endosymbiont (group A) of Anomoia purmunda]|uniref:hypothetical protein n=1 Tax=Wolbachia endosymbiont (group A) of Anomoia purmunda TaxID=2953978 RepID=UPI00222F43BC|nr:hypothetical protein [Wolbachia endosymbiont (group A) of Anomoia purmunda]
MANLSRCSFFVTSVFVFVIPVRDTGIYLIFIMDIILTYAPTICCPLYNFQIFLYLDPSVTHWDDRKESTGMTRGGLLK